MQIIIIITRDSHNSILSMALQNCHTHTRHTCAKTKPYRVSSCSKSNSRFRVLPRLLCPRPTPPQCSYKHRSTLPTPQQRRLQHRPRATLVSTQSRRLKAAQRDQHTHLALSVLVSTLQAASSHLFTRRGICSYRLSMCALSTHYQPTPIKPAQAITPPSHAASFANALLAHPHGVSNSHSTPTASQFAPKSAPQPHGPQVLRLGSI